MDHYTRPQLSGQALTTALEQHEGLVHAVIRRQGGGELTYEEALHAGRIGLWQALLGYDPTRGTAFSTYAWVAITRHIREYDRELRKLYAVSPSVPREDEACADPAHSWEVHLIRHELRALMQQLPEPLREVIVRRYGLGSEAPCTLQALGEEWGVSREWIRQLQLTALAWLRHPAYSVRLRELTGTNTPAAYRRALEQNATLRRARRAA
jgi:RNA polymerase sigma factor (sigma-70 family)